MSLSAKKLTDLQASLTPTILQKPALKALMSTSDVLQKPANEHKADLHAQHPQPKAPAKLSRLKRDPQPRNCNGMFRIVCRFARAEGINAVGSMCPFVNNSCCEIYRSVAGFGRRSLGLTCCHGPGPKPALTRTSLQIDNCGPSTQKP